MFSPDGRFIAYSAAAGGRESVYVKPYPALDRRWTISPGNGQLPMWSPDGRTLYYVDGSRMYAVALEPSADGDIRPGAPELLFDRPFFRNPQGDQSYDLAADGSLIMIDGLRRATPVVVVNWLSEARRRP
jgi:Tol biopolymer transport system component